MQRQGRGGRSYWRILPRLRMVCCAGWLGRSLHGWKRIASGFGAMISTGRALGVAWRDII